MDFNALDITITVLVFLMAIKGLMNGFAREFFGFLGLIGGIFIASRAAEPIARQIDSRIFHLENFAALELIGFLAVLATVWFITSSIGNLYLSTSRDKPSSSIGMAFGFVTAGTKYFLIFSLIVSALFRSPLLQENMAKSIKKSQLYPVLDRVGSTIINLKPLQPKIKTTKPKVK